MAVNAEMQKALPATKPFGTSLRLHHLTCLAYMRQTWSVDETIDNGFDVDVAFGAL